MRISDWSSDVCSSDLGGEAERVLLDYGQAIKDLARSNLFPGDLLLKNFGVSRSGRVVFYDYDELCLVTECRFRKLPIARHHEEEIADGAWFHVGEHDVFPERSEEHTSELQSLMRISYAVFC